MASTTGTFCPKCGSPAAREDAFCRSCGSRLSDGRQPTDAEVKGRTAGEEKGYQTRSYAKVAGQPVVETVWDQRPNIPTWQKVLGAIAWPAMLLTPHGWVFLAGSFFVMVILGDHTPYSWAVWVTKWAGIFLAATVVVLLVVLAASSGGSSSGAILTLRP